MRQKEDLRIRKTKTTLYKSYLDLISKKEYDQIKISDICKRSNINRSTFYDHFKDKEELASSLLTDTKIEISNELNNIIANKKTLKEIFPILIDKIREIIDNNMVIKTLLISNPNLIRQSIASILYEIIKKELDTEKDNYVEPSTYAMFYSEGLTALLLKKEIKIEEIKKITQNKK